MYIYDFSILVVFYGKYPTLFYYNDAHDKFVTVNAVTNSSKLFPSSTEELNGYKIRLGVIPEWPEVYYNNYGVPAEMKPLLTLYKVYQCFEKHINATTTPIILGNLEIRNTQIMNHKLDMVLSDYDIAFGIWNYANLYIFDYSKFVVLAPFTNEYQITASKDIFISCLIISSLIILIVTMVHRSKIKNTGWTVFNIFNLMLGNYVNIKLPNFYFKVTFVILSFFSFFFISDIISNLTKINYESKEVLLAENIDEILMKKLDVYALHSKIVYETFVENSEGNVKILFEKLEYDRLNNLHDNAVIISFQKYAEIFIFENDVKGIKKYKILDMNLPVLTFALFFCHYSPLKIKFAEVRQNIYEFGLDKKWASEFEVTIIPDKNKFDFFFKDSHVLILILASIIIIGMFISIIILFIELVIDYLTVKKILRRILPI